MNKVLTKIKALLPMSKGRLGNVSFVVAGCLSAAFIVWVILGIVFVFTIAKFEPYAKWLVLPLGILIVIPSFLIWVAGFVLSPAGIVMGVMGVFQRDQSKIVALTGVVLNMVILGLYLLIVPRIHPS